MRQGTENNSGYGPGLGGLECDSVEVGNHVGGLFGPFSALLLVLCQTQYSTAEVLRAKLVCAYRGLGGAPQRSCCQDQISTPLQTKRSVALGVPRKSLSIGALVS